MKGFLQFIDEKETLKSMRDKYKAVFPYSDPQDIKVLNSTEKGKDTLQLHCRGTIESENSSKTYNCLIQLHRKTLNDDWTIDDIGEVKCTCKAFRYNVAYPLLINKNYFGTVPGYSRIPNRIRNPKKVPTFCKHVYSYIRYLIKKRIIKL